MPMTPVNWHQFQCVRTFVKEKRKVAKPEFVVS